jgi:hypothetical protein
MDYAMQYGDKAGLADRWPFSQGPVRFLWGELIIQKPHQNNAEIMLKLC